jgi:hypothetical protein
MSFVQGNAVDPNGRSSNPSASPLQGQGLSSDEEDPEPNPNPNLPEGLTQTQPGIFHWEDLDLLFSHQDLLELLVM